MSGSLGYRNSSAVSWHVERETVRRPAATIPGVGYMPKILVIDDEPDLRLALSITLDDYGYEVVEGVDGSEAMDLAVTHAPDLIILDLNMPNVDGLTALEALKADERTSSVPVCILTAVTDPKREERAFALGAGDIIGKPWSEERLVRSLGDLIRKSHEAPGHGDAPDSGRRGLTSTHSSSQERVDRLSETIRARHDMWSA